MRFRLLIIFVMQFAMVVAAFAEDCLESADEFNSRCSQFPQPFDSKLPLRLFLEAGLGRAAVKIESVGPKLKILAHVDGLGDPYTTESYIEKICFHPDKLEVYYQGAQRPKEVLIKQGKAKIEGHYFAKCDEAQFNKTAKKIENAIIKTKERQNEVGTN